MQNVSVSNQCRSVFLKHKKYLSKRLLCGHIRPSHSIVALDKTSMDFDADDDVLEVYLLYLLSVAFTFLYVNRKKVDIIALLRYSCKKTF